MCDVIVAVLIRRFGREEKQCLLVIMKANFRAFYLTRLFVAFRPAFLIVKYCKCLVDLIAKGLKTNVIFRPNIN